MNAIQVLFQLSYSPTCRYLVNKTVAACQVLMTQISVADFEILGTLPLIPAGQGGVAPCLT